MLECWRGLGYTRGLYRIASLVFRFKRIRVPGTEPDPSKGPLRRVFYICTDSVPFESGRAENLNL